MLLLSSSNIVVNVLLLSSGTSLLMLDQLRQFSSTSISDTVHQELLNKLYHMMLNYRMKETVFSRVCMCDIRYWM